MGSGFLFENAGYLADDKIAYMMAMRVADSLKPINIKHHNSPRFTADTLKERVAIEQTSHLIVLHEKLQLLI